MSSREMKQWFPRLPSALDRAPMAGLMCAGALLLGVALAGARSSNTGENGTPAVPKSIADSAVKPAGENQEKTARFCEGDELVDQTGRFDTSGDRLVFITTDGQHRCIVLENLALERLKTANDVKSAPLQWTVSGKITEYRGSTYLLLARAQSNF